MSRLFRWFGIIRTLDDLADMSSAEKVKAVNFDIKPIWEGWMCVGHSVIIETPIRNYDGADLKYDGANFLANFLPIDSLAVVGAWESEKRALAYALTAVEVMRHKGIASMINYRDPVSYVEQRLTNGLVSWSRELKKRLEG